MKFIVVIAMGLLIGAGFAFARDAAPDKKTEPINKKCPVGEDEVDPAITVAYDGKTVGFCCKSCIKDFKKDPKKYMKILAENGDDSTAAKEEQPADDGDKKPKSDKPVNKNCLVHPENAVDALCFEEYEGKVYGFCCEDCQKSFNADPDRYVKGKKKK